MTQELVQEKQFEAAKQFDLPLPPFLPFFLCFSLTIVVICHPSQQNSILDELDRMYSKENWPVVLSNILQTSLSCCLALSLTNEATDRILQLLHPQTPISSDLKKMLQHDLIQMQVDPHSMNLPPLKETKLIRLLPSSPLISLDFQFKEAKVSSQDLFSYRIRILSNFPSPIRFSLLQVVFRDSLYDGKLVDDVPISLVPSDCSAEPDKDSLLLFPNRPRVFEFTKIAKSPCVLQVSLSLLNSLSLSLS